MSKEILTIDNIEIEKNKQDFFSRKKAISTLLVTCIMIIKLSHYIKCFLKQGLM